MAFLRSLDLGYLFQKSLNFRRILADFLQVCYQPSFTSRLPRAFRSTSCVRDNCLTIACSIPSLSLFVLCSRSTVDWRRRSCVVKRRRNLLTSRRKPSVCIKQLNSVSAKMHLFPSKTCESFVSRFSKEIDNVEQPFLRSQK